MNEHMDFGPYFLLHLLLNSIQDDDFAKKIVRTVEPEIFKTKERKFLYKIIKDYVEEFDEAPKDLFFEIYTERKEELDDRSQKVCKQVINSLHEIHHSNPEYFLNRLSKAIRHYEFENALVNSAQLLKNKQYDSAVQLMLKAIKKPQEVKKTYYNFLKDTSYIESRSQGQTYKMKTLIRELDALIGGFNPTWLITLLAATKGGKSWWLIEMATAALVQGLSVLFVSLEMSKAEIDGRFDQNIGFLGTKQDEEVEVMEHQGGKWVKIKKVVETIYDIKKVERNRRALRKMGGKLYVSDQSSSKFSYLDLELLLDEIEQNEGMVFDTVVVDYLGEMGSPDKKVTSKKEIIASNTSGLKGIAKERNLIVLTAQQGNRKAMQSKTFRSDLISDAIEPVFVSDLIMTLNQTKKEEAQNVFRIYIANYRHGEQHKYLPLTRDLSRGQPILGLGEVVKEDDEEPTGEEYGDF